MAQDIIWVWGENGPDAALESAMSSPALLQVPPGKKVIRGAITQRELPYSWEFFVENVMVSTHASYQSYCTILSALTLSLQEVEGRPSTSLSALWCSFSIVDSRVTMFQRRVVPRLPYVVNQFSSVGCRSVTPLSSRVELQLFPEYA